jgi:hypothetical protein
VNTALPLQLPAPPPGLRRRTSDLLYSRRGLLLLALLAPPLLWFGVIYLGSLFTLLANAFFGLDDFTGQVVRELTLKNFVALAEPANLDAIRRSLLMAAVVTLVCTLLAFPLAFYMARHASGAHKALLYIAVMLLPAGRGAHRFRRPGRRPRPHAESHAALHHNQGHALALGLVQFRRPAQFFLASGVRPALRSGLCRGP